MQKYIVTAVTVLLLNLVALGTWLEVAPGPGPGPNPDDPTEWTKCWYRKVWWDPDEIEVKLRLRTVTLKLAGVECPTRGEEFYEEARGFVQGLLRDKELEYLSWGRRKWRVFNASLREIGGQEINRMVLQAGWGRWDAETSYDEELLALQEEAQVNKRGIWAGEVPPLPPDDDLLILDFYIEEGSAGLSFEIPVGGPIGVQSGYWWLLWLVTSVLLVWGVKVESVDGCTFVLLAALVMLFLFGDTLAYLKAILYFMTWVKMVGVYAVCGLVWGIVVLFLGRWEADLDELVVNAAFWPWAVLAWGMTLAFWWIWKLILPWWSGKVE